MAACDTTRPLTDAQREAGFDQQRTGVGQALRPFSGSPTVENLIDYCNRELVPVLRATRNAANDVWKQVVDNAPSANPLAYYFSTTTTAADPTAGRVRLNQATQNTATIIRVSESNARLQSIQPWLDVMSGGPTTPLGTVTLLDAINPGRFLRFDLNTMTDQGAYWDLGVTFIEGSDTSPFVDGEAVTLGFIAGVSAAGSTVPVTALSPIANDTFVGNVSGGTAAPAAVALSTLAGAGLTFGTHTINATAGAGGSLVVSANDIQRAALTGFATASQDSNATSSAEPIVTYSASANMSAERVTTSSTSITVDTSVASQIQFQRAALTGEATASANANAVTVTRSTDFQASPWTGNHQFNAELRLGTTHTASSASGTLNVTLTAGATRLVISSSADVNLNTITGCAEGRVLWVEHVRGSGTGNLIVNHDATSANAIACPGNRPYVLGDRGGFFLVGRVGANANWKMFAKDLYAGDTLTESGGGTFNDYAVPDDIKVLAVGTDATFTGFARASGNIDGDRFWVRTNDGINCTLKFNSGSSTSGNRVSAPEAVDFSMAGRCLVEMRYESSSWRVISPTTGRGRLLVATSYTETSPGSGTHTFDARAKSYLVHIKAGQGGGGGANSAASEIAVGGQGGWGTEILVYVTTVPTSVTYTIGAAGTGGANTGADGGDATNSAWDTITAIPAGKGGKGSANATVGSGSGTTLGATAGGLGGTGITGSLPTGGTLLMSTPGVAGGIGIRMSSSAGWGGGDNTSTAAVANGSGIGALSSNNTDRAGGNGEQPRIAVWEFS